ETIVSVQRRVIWAGLLQVGLTILLVLALTRFFGLSIEIGIFYGFLLSLSSTAIVLRIYNDRREINSIQGRLASGVLLFQYLCIVLICLGTAWLASESGLSLALGALIAGLVISESELSHQIIADVLPLRDCFSGIFFISIGMLLNLDLLTRDFLTPLMNLLLIVGFKSLVIVAVFWWLFCWFSFVSCFLVVLA